MNAGKKNVYLCQDCRKIIITLDVDEGTTPFMLLCEVTPGCNGAMYSQFYQVDQRLPHTHEWYMPKSFEGHHPLNLEHFQKGGLALRTKDGDPTRAFPIKKKWKLRTRRRRK